MNRIALAALILTLMGAASAPALAQGQNCVSAGLLRVDTAFSRQGSGGTFNYSVQVSNTVNRPVRFRITFRLPTAQPNPANLSTIYTLPPNANQIYLVGNGLELSTSSRIGGSVLLNCV